MRETFTRLPNDANWVKVNGGVLSTQCGVLSSGNAMHMKGVRSGLLGGGFSHINRLKGKDKD